MAQDGYKYWAFISYSHRDRAWGNWLHQTLETYRVPSRLVGRESRDGKVPARMFPIFRDRDELPSSADLGGVINQALADSRYQIVICSPRSAASRWVNEEIRHFKSLGRSDRVLCLIVDGEPNVFDVPGRDIEECFAPALRFKVTADGVITDIPAEPIAADAREHADGKAGAKLKLLSGLLGVGFDELKQREQQRQFWKRVQAIAAGLAFAAMVVGAWQWYTHQRDAREREITIEKIVENGRQELLSGRQARAAVFLNEAYKMGNDSAAVRFMLGQAMQPIEALSPVRVRHGGKAVHGAAFSPDGTKFALVVLTDDSSWHEKAVAQVYESGTGKKLVELPGAPLRPTVIRFLPDGRHLLIAGMPSDGGYAANASNSDIYLWDLELKGTPLHLLNSNGVGGLPINPAGTELLLPKGRALQFLDANSGRVAHALQHALEVTASTFSPDGHAVAFADSAGVVEIWSADGSRKLQEFHEAQGQSIKSIMFAPDGKRLLSLSDIDDVRIWDLKTSRLTAAFVADDTRVISVQFSNDGQRLLTVGAAGYKVWSATRGSLLLDMQRSLNTLASAALSPDGSTLITADYVSNIAEAWDVLAKRKMYSLDLHTSGVSAAAFNLAGDSLLIASRDGTAEIWRMPVAPSWKYESFDALPPYRARFDPAGTRLVVAAGNLAAGGAMIFDLKAQQPVETYPWHKLVAFDAAYSPDGAHLATASADGTAVLWDEAHHARIALLDHSPSRISRVEFAADGSRLLTFPDDLDLAPPDSRAGLWDGNDGHLIGWLAHESYVCAAAFDTTGKHVATGGEDGRIQIWNALDGQRLRVIDPHRGRIRSVQFSADGALLLTSQENTATLWNPVSGAAIASFEDPALGQPTTAMFSPTGQIAVGTQQGNIWLWRPQTGKAALLKGHESWLQGLRFLHGGALLLSYGNDGTARVWDTATSTQLGVVAAQEGSIKLADLDHSESRIVTSSWGTVSLWNIKLEDRPALRVSKVLADATPWTYDAATENLTQTTPGYLRARQ